MKIIIIGAGPGGYETALLAAKRGVEVVLIEAGHVGGTCLNEGCIPTKTFCRNAEVLDGLKEAAAFGVTDLSYGFDFSAVVQRKNAVVEQLRGGVEGLLGHKLITFVRGKAAFVDEHTVMVTPVVTADGSEDCGQDRESRESKVYSADYIIIATGSISASLPIPGADLPGILTSKEILDIQEIPKSLCVIGGGVIGLEFASIFRSFGSEVTVLEYCKDILPRFDTDLAKRLKQSLGKKGINIETQAQVTGIEILHADLNVQSSDESGKDSGDVSGNDSGDESGDTSCQVAREASNERYSISYTRKGKEETVLAEKVLMAVGRKANIASLNLDDIGLEYTARGIVVNDKTMQTNIPHIYAVGDINGKMMLAHAATYQGIVALDHIMGIANEIDLSVMPAAVFTSPEAASVGLTEDECKEKGIPVKCLKSFFRANGKAVTMGETDGFCKVVVSDGPSSDPESQQESNSDRDVEVGAEIRPGQILGCHLYGPHASDIIQEACVLISRKATLEQCQSIIHTHPTLTEVFQSALHSS